MNRKHLVVAATVLVVCLFGRRGLLRSGTVYRVPWSEGTALDTSIRGAVGPCGSHGGTRCLERQ